MIDNLNKANVSRRTKTQMASTPTLYGKGAQSLLESLRIKPTERSKENGRKLVEYFKDKEVKSVPITKISPTVISFDSDEKYDEFIEWAESKEKETSVGMEQMREKMKNHR